MTKQPESTSVPTPGPTTLTDRDVLDARWSLLQRQSPPPWVVFVMALWWARRVGWTVCRAASWITGSDLPRDKPNPVVPRTDFERAVDDLVDRAGIIENP